MKGVNSIVPTKPTHVDRLRVKKMARHNMTSVAMRVDRISQPERLMGIIDISRAIAIPLAMEWLYLA